MVGHIVVSSSEKSIYLPMLQHMKQSLLKINRDMGFIKFFFIFGEKYSKVLKPIMPRKKNEMTLTYCIVYGVDEIDLDLIRKEYFSNV